MIMNYFTQINQGSLLELNFYTQVYFNSWCMDHSQVSDVELIVLLYNHELTFP